MSYLIMSLCACMRCIIMLSSDRLHLSAVWFVHQEHLTPDLDPGGLPLGAPPPGEAGQRLFVISEPAFRRLSTTGSQVLVSMD